MAYVEFLRARTSLAWHIGILAVVTLISLYFAHATHVVVNGESRLVAGTPVPIGGLALIAMFFGAIFASSSGASLNRENATRDLSWTKPIPRGLLALQYVLIDVAAIVVAFAVALLAVILVVVRTTMVPVFATGTLAEVLLGVGVAVMWYALIQLLTFGFGPGARAVSGIIWPVALLLLGLGQIDGPVGAIVRALDIFNPLAYISGTDMKVHANGQNVQTVSPLPLEFRLLAVWFFSALFLAIVIALWPKKEA
jgi:hypothetical protein